MNPLSSALSLARRPGPSSMESSDTAELPQTADEARNPLLTALGERVRNLRAQRGLTRKAAAQAAGVSERHLANLEYGTGNASILVLHQVASALHCPLAELLGDFTTRSPEWLLIRELLEHRSEAELRRARLALHALLNSGASDTARHGRIALIGLRGAGKSTLGPLLARDLGVPFIELSREIEALAGCSVREIHDLYGATAYRRYERRALEEVVQIHADVVVATPGASSRTPPRSTNCWRIAPPCGCAPRPRSTWAASLRKATCARWLPAGKPWTTCAASWRGARPSTRKPT